MFCLSVEMVVWVCMCLQYEKTETFGNASEGGVETIQYRATDSTQQGSPSYPSHSRSCHAISCPLRSPQPRNATALASEIIKTPIEASIVGSIDG